MEVSVWTVAARVCTALLRRPVMLCASAERTLSDAVLTNNAEKSSTPAAARRFALRCVAPKRRRRSDSRLPCRSKVSSARLDFSVWPPVLPLAPVLPPCPTSHVATLPRRNPACPSPCPPKSHLSPIPDTDSILRGIARDCRRLHSVSCFLQNEVRAPDPAPFHHFPL